MVPFSQHAARQSHEVTYGARVDSHAIILVIDRSVLDSDCVRRPNIEGISILSQRITSGGIDSNVSQFQVGSAVDGEDLDWRVENRQSLNK